jgi:hypothetical protein
MSLGRRQRARSSYSPNVRFYLAVLIFASIVSACGSGNGGQRAEAPSSTRVSPEVNGKVERCVDRLMQHATIEADEKKAARRYVRITYCARFEKEGWVYEDGALGLAAQTWLDNSGTCASSDSEPGRSAGPTRTVPCKPEQRGGVRVVECALLRIVRRGEVGDYIDQLRRNGPVECDDGTPISELGIP